MKKLLLLAFAVTIILSAAACSNPEKNNAKPTPSPKTEATPEPEKLLSRDVTFYYPDEAAMYLIPEVKKVKSDDSEFLASVVKAVIQGPKDDSLNPSVSGNVRVLSVKNKDGICTIDLSSEFSENNTGGSTKESMAIYSIVNTLCGIDGIDKVKINIEGDENPDFGGHFSLDEPFEPDWTMVNNN